ncbi:MAG: aminoacyl-tRNA hydrolase [Candidatus Wallbacteria bacterium]|nr:aminoacyl-tRNA hydrolase [Candidatus Wallbacteria bacterium]
MNLWNRLLDFLGRRVSEPCRTVPQASNGAIARIVLGLGNPGDQYRCTRHNLGRESLEEFSLKFNQKDELRLRFCHGCRIFLDSDTFYLFFPDVYMNLSGRPALEICEHLDSLKIAFELLVISDDLDLPFGRLRFRKTGSSGGHNGIKSILQSLGGREFLRLRLGIGNVGAKRDPDFVLGRYESTEEAKLPAVKAFVSEALDCYLRNGFEKAMQEFNGRSIP